MRNPMPSLTFALAGLLCMAPFAFAAPALTGTLSIDGAASVGPVSGAADHGADVGGHRAAAQAAIEDVTANATVDFSHADLGGDGFWSWFSVRLDALVAQLADLLGQDVAAHAGADVKVSDQGIALDAFVDDVTLDGAASGDAGAMADGALAKVHETKATAASVVPPVG